MDENAFVIQIQALSFKREQFLFKVRNISAISSAQKEEKIIEYSLHTIV
jgi:hypothetical protein